LERRDRQRIKTHLFYRRWYFGAGRIEVIDLTSGIVIQALKRDSPWAKWIVVG
jgi:hypothetical protein